MKDSSHRFRTSSVCVIPPAPTRTRAFRADRFIAPASSLKLTKWLDGSGCASNIIGPPTRFSTTISKRPELNRSSHCQSATHLRLPKGCAGLHTHLIKCSVVSIAIYQFSALCKPFPSLYCPPADIRGRLRGWRPASLCWTGQETRHPSPTKGTVCLSDSGCVRGRR